MSRNYLFGNYLILRLKNFRCQLKNVGAVFIIFQNLIRVNQRKMFEDYRPIRNR